MREVPAGGRPFLVLCGSSILFYLSFQLLLSVIPLYTVRLGGREVHVGLVTGLFAGTAMVLRPVAGVLTDTLGRRPLILAGGAIFALASLGYTAVGSVAALLALRVFHGTGMGLAPTAATVVVADVSPPERRGEAMGVYSLTITTGSAIGPWLGIELYRGLGPAPMFLVSAAIAACAVALAWTLPETRPAPGRAGAWRRGLFSRAALYPAALILGLYVGFGALVSFLPLYAERRGLGNPGLLFTVFALAGLAVRWGAGRLADRLGRRLVVAPALVLAGLGLVLLAQARTTADLVLAGVIYGLGFGAAQPALMAMTVDRVPPEERGRALGTLYTAWELGIMTGAVALGLLVGLVGFERMWWLLALLTWLTALGATRDVRRRRG
ncbi:MAG TPA: MFS transporter [Candidatus Rokubacteria bacterium]|nr:MFS transporter [Candidatus Rokubacteria bacterium]